MPVLKSAHRPGIRTIQIGIALIVLAILVPMIPSRMFDSPVWGFMLGVPGFVVLVVGLIVRAVKGKTL